ncbi:hypothetical protein MWU38_03215 [Qipengyuania sp. S6317L1]|uniref:hypothetical protein n=1 Tax=Qipengyuania sp. S6317L1 TaxID=2926410 RepID=UPI001FF3FA37|nr:hypothetical protein [Qipengyuania sp. S6317L1]MCK0098385.1 hypothetical protein [Qipengyuania sp. S6317L1]
MANTIGLRFYRVSFHEGRGAPSLMNDDRRLFQNDDHLLNEFVVKHQQVTTIEDAQRGWFFEVPDQSKPRKVSGRITYGIHGITSRFVDLKTREEEFKRKNNHLE